MKPLVWRWRLALTALVVAGLLANAATAQDQPKEAPKKEAKPDFPFPDIEKFLPGGLDADQIKQIREQLEKARQEYQKAMEQFRKQFPGGLPGASRVVFPAASSRASPSDRGRLTVWASA